MTVDALLEDALGFLTDLGVADYFTAAVGAAIVLSLVGFMLRKFTGNAGGR